MPSTEDVAALRGRAAELEAELSRTWKRIGEIERRCHHEWGETTYDPIRRPLGVEISSTNGISFPKTTSPRWSRRCVRCQKIQYTTASKPSGLVADFGK